MRRNIMALVWIITLNGCRDTITNGNGPPPHNHVDVYKPVGTDTNCPAGQVVSGIDTSSGNVVCTTDANTDLTAHLKGLEAMIADLETRHAELETADFCPRLTAYGGTRRIYTLESDPEEEGVTHCVFGADEMVKVGDFWVDVYEAILVNAARFASGTCDGDGLVYGSTEVDDYPIDFPDNGNWSTLVYACSVGSAMPSALMTWFQAQQACALAGKRLCRNDEWQAAVTGTPDMWSDMESPPCNVATAGPTTGEDFPVCVSRYGTRHQIGNLAEWTTMWTVEPGWNGLLSNTWPDSGGASYGSDGYMHGGAVTDPAYGTDGSHEVATVGPNTRIPAAVLRGGQWSDGTAAGAFAVNVSAGPSYLQLSIGARCCAGR